MMSDQSSSSVAVVFNSLRMNLWVIRCAGENHPSPGRPHPSREMVQKELPSTPPTSAFPLVILQLRIAVGCESPGRYPRSAQANRVSPTGPNLLSTGPVDNALFRPVSAAYGSRIDLSQHPRARTCQCLSLAFRTRIRLVLRRVSDGLGAASSRMCKE